YLLNGDIKQKKLLIEQISYNKLIDVIARVSITCLVHHWFMYWNVHLFATLDYTNICARNLDLRIAHILDFNFSLCMLQERYQFLNNLYVHVVNAITIC
ncbi:hypothetical protein ACJX0J_037238, partial [Zea mays]